MIDNKQRILIAFYVEYQKDLPSYDNVNEKNLNVSRPIYVHNEHKLEEEELIVAKPRMDLSTYYRPTLKGIEYIEKLFNIKETLPNIVKLEDIGYEAQEVKDDSLVAFIKNAIIEIDSRYEEHFKEKKFEQRIGKYFNF